MSIIIVGGGKFGLKAIEYAKEICQKAILIDNNPQCQAISLSDRQFKNYSEFKENIAQLNENELYFVNDEINIINEIVTLMDIKYVIPVVPIHLMASIISFFIQKNSINLIPDINGTKNFTFSCDKNLLLSSNIHNGIVFLSHAKADELCPDNCSGPLNFCPHFKREKYKTITRYLREYYKINHYIDINEGEIINITIIIESYQLKPGLGGLVGDEINTIINLLEHKISSYRDKYCKIVVATTCNCHGVITFFKKEEN